MKVVINHCYGGFSLSDKAMKTLGLNSRFDPIDRTDERLVTLVEEDFLAASGTFAKLVTRTIPDNATDWQIIEQDGFEFIIYVVNGKMYRCF